MYHIHIFFTIVWRHSEHNSVSLRLKHNICFSFSQHLNTWSPRHMNIGTLALSALDWSFISARPNGGRMLFLI